MRRLVGELLRPQMFLEIDGRNRLAVEKALRFLAALSDQKRRLRFGFDAFGDDLEAEIVPHYDQ